MSASLSRRQLFRIRLGDLPGLFSKGRKADRSSLRRPPGACAEEAFLERCERCGACADACPHDIIRFLGPAGGIGEGTPVLQLAEAPCRWCVDMPCVAACSSEALSEAALKPLGKVSLNLDECLTSQGIFCDTCSLFCPPEVRAIRMVRRQPVLDVEACVGCGMCVFYCESDGQPLMIEPCSETTEGEGSRPEQASEDIP